MSFQAISHTSHLPILLCLLMAVPVKADLVSSVRTVQAIHQAMTPAQTKASPTQKPTPDQTAEQPDAFDASPLELDSQRFNFQRDWWKYSIMLVVFAVCSCLLLKVAKQILSFLIIVACLAASAGLAYLTGPTLEPLLKQYAPSLDCPRCPALYWAYGIIFLIAYAMATLIVRFVRKPAEAGDGGKGKAK